MRVTTPRSVGIIGAGVSGLSAARLLMAEGIECTLFERGERLGGVWAAGYTNFGAQVQRELYEFPDFPLPEDIPDFAPGHLIRDYLEHYARETGVWPHIRLQADVVRMEKDESNSAASSRSTGGWRVAYRHAGSLREETFDAMIVATGLYSNRPNIPHLPGRHRFPGKVIHVSEFTRREMAEGRRVAVVGYGKSATDAAQEASAVASETTLVFRQAHWPVPQKLLGILPFKWAMLSRLTSALIPPYYRPSSAERVLHTLGKPLVWLWWRLVERLLIAQCRLGSKLGTRPSLVPSQPVEIDTFGEAVMLPRPEFFRLLRTGGIEPRQGEIRELDESGLRLSGGGRVDADLVILATGWETDHSFLPDSTRAALGFEEDGLYLYRQIVCPGLNDIFFMGAASTISSILTYSLQARWLAELLSGRLELPDTGAMREEIDEIKAWKRRWMPASSARGARLLLHQMHYHDQLLEDIGADPRRKTGILAPFKEVFAPYQPSDYATVVSGKWAASGT